MIGKALRWLRSVYFGVPATSVTPETVPLPPFPWVSNVEPPFVKVNSQCAADVKVADMMAERYGTFPREWFKPPADPEAEGWTWDAWEREQRAMTATLAGWTPCRFGTRRGPEARFVFGVVRNGFGLWRQNMKVTRVDGEGNVTTFHDNLTCTTHIRSGSGLGIFEKIETAAIALDIAGKAFDFSKITELAVPAWKEAEARILSAWFDMGIVPAMNSQCTEKNGTSYQIYGMSVESAMVGKPEKLS